MTKTFLEDLELTKLANKIITEHNLAYMNSVRARYLLVEPNISKTCPAKVIKASNELRHFAQSDFFVEFSKDIWDSIDDETREILMHHSLNHILVKTNPKGKEVFTIADHDVKDFSEIIKKYGVNWFQQFKNLVAATYELEGYDKDRISI